MVDVLGLLICIVVHAANIQERACGKRVLAKAAGKGLPRLEKVLAESPQVKEPWIFESNEQKFAHLAKKIAHSTNPSLPKLP